MDRRKDPSRIFYPHGWRELVNGSLEEGFGEYNLSEHTLNMTAPIALATIDNLTTEYYVPQKYVEF